MQPLRDVQSTVLRSLVTGDVVGLAGLMSTAGHEIDALLDIHRRTCTSTLTNALRLSFPGLRGVLGEPAFDRIVHDFVRSHPPASAWLETYGRELPTFVARHVDAARSSIAVDIAAIDAAVQHALHSHEQTCGSAARPIDELGELAEAALARVVLVPHGSVTLLWVDPVAERRWRSIVEGNEIATPQDAAPHAGQPLLVNRTVIGAQVVRLSQDDWPVALELCRGSELGAVHAGREAEFGPRLSTLLELGIFIGFKT